MSKWRERARNYLEHQEEKKITDAMSGENLLTRVGHAYDYLHRDEDKYVTLSKKWQDMYKRALDYYNNESHQSFYDTYSGTRNKTGYVADTGEWYNNLEMLKTQNNADAEKLLAELDQYSRYYNADAVKYMRDLITKRKSSYDDMMTDAKKFSDHWGQWGDEDAYTFDLWKGDVAKALDAGDYDAAEKLVGERARSRVSSQEEADEYFETEEYKELVEIAEVIKQSKEYNDYVAEEARKKAEYEAYDADAGAAEIDELKKKAESLEMPILVSWFDRDRADELDAVKQEILDKQAYHDEAVRMQALYKLSDDALKDTEFEKYAVQGMAIENPKMPGWSLLENGDEIGNIVTYSRDNADVIRANEAEHVDIAGDAKYAQMTEDEVKIYSYYLAKYGKEKAQEYLDAIDGDLVQRESDYIQGINRQFAKDHPILGSLGSVATSLGSGVEYVGDLIGYAADLSTDPYGARMDKNTLAEVTNTVRGAVSEKVSWEIAGWDAGAFIYNTVMSGADSATAAFLPGGAVVLGLSAAAQGTNDALERGMSSEQAFWNGAFSGVFEGLFEKFSIGNLKSFQKAVAKGGKDIAKNIAKSMLVNASEEAATEVANILYDTIANGDYSNYTMEELRNGAWVDALGQVVESAASGALMGLAFGGAGSVMSEYQSRKTGKQYTSNPSALIEEALRVDPNNAYALNLKARLDAGAKISQAQLGKLSFGNMETVRSNLGKIDEDAHTRLNERIEKRISSKVEDKKARSSLAQSLTKAISGENISNSELRKISQNQAALNVLNDEFGTRFKSGVAIGDIRQAISTRQNSKVKLSSENILATYSAYYGMDEAAERSLMVNYAADTRNAEGGKVIAPEEYAALYNAVYVAGKKGNDISKISGELSSVMSESAIAQAYRAGQNAGAAVKSEGSEQSGVQYSVVNGPDGGFDVISEVDGESAVVASYKSHKQAQAAVYARTLGMGENGTKGLVTLADDVESVAQLGDVAAAYNAIYNQGKRGEGMSAGKYASVLTQEQMEYAYNNGIMDRALESNKNKNSSNQGLKNDAESGKIETSDGDAIWRYKSSESYKINEAIRSGRELTAEESAFIEELDRDLEKTPKYSGVVYRNMTFDMQGQEALDNFVAGHTIGEIVTYPAYTSTSKTQEGYVVDGELLVHIEIFGETGHDVSKGYGIEEEQEVLFGRNTDFYVSSISYDGKTANIVLEEVTYGEGKISGSDKGYNSAQQGYHSKSRASQMQRMQAPEQVDVQKVSERHTEGDSSQREALRGVRGEINSLTESENGHRGTPDIQTVKENAIEPERVVYSSQKAMAYDAVSESQLDNAQKKAVNIGKAIGIKVVVADTRTTKGVAVDGFLGKDGVIYISKNNKNPVAFIFKHELAHFCERAGQKYKDFQTAVRNSATFKSWLKKKGYGSMLEYNSQMRQERSAVGIDPRERGANNEIISNFVAETMFGDDTTLADRLIGELKPKERRSVREFLRDFFDWIKGKITGKDNTARTEIHKLEKMFAEAFRTAVKSGTDANGEQFAFNISFGQQLNDWQKGNGKANGSYNGKFFKLGTTPDVLIKHGAPSGEVIMYEDCLLKITGLKHSISLDELSKIPAQLNDPILLFKGSVDNSFVALTEIKDKIGNDVIVAVHINKRMGRSVINKITSVYSKTDNYGNNKIKNYVIEQINQGNLLDASIKKAPNWFTTSGLQLPHVVQTILDANNSISQNSEKSTQNSKKFFGNDGEQFSYTSKQELSEEDYNRFGWVRDNDVISAGYWKNFTENFAQAVTGNYTFPKNKNGEFMIDVYDAYDSSGIADVIVFASGTIESPNVTKIVKIDLADDVDIETKRSNLYAAERKGIRRTTGKVFVFYDKLDFIGRRRNQGNGAQSVGNNNRLNVRRGASETKANRIVKFHVDEDRGTITITYANGETVVESLNGEEGTEQFSYTSQQEMIDDIFERARNGEISINEAQRQVNDILNKKRGDDPISIANMKAEDMNTTPNLYKRSRGDYGDGNSKFAQSANKSSIFDEKFKKEIEDDNYVNHYRAVSNKETLKEAVKLLDEGGRDFVNKWYAMDEKKMSAVDTAVGFILLKRYQDIGEYHNAALAAEKIRKIGTIAGQTVQIFSIIGRFNADTMQAYAQKQLDDALAVAQKEKGLAWAEKNKEKFKLTDDEISFIRDNILYAATLPENSRSRAIALAEICTLLQDKLPPKKGQALRAWQRTSMLLNPKTQLRNIAGNGLMVPVFIASDWFSSPLDWAISKKTGIRTTGVSVSGAKAAAKGFIKGGSESFDDFKRKINTKSDELNRFSVGEGKSYNENGRSKMLNKAAKALNEMDRFTSFCLDFGDRPFFEAWFMRSLENQMRLNNVNEPTDAMIEIATLEALERTWQDNNGMTKFVTGLKRGMNKLQINGYGVGDIIIKFAKTPANLTKAIYDYSPAAIISVTNQCIKFNRACKDGTLTPAMQKRFVSTAGKALAGSLVYIIAAALYSAGLLSGAADDDDDMAAFERYIQGQPSYSIKIGDKWFSYDWAQPVGAAAAIVTDYMESKDEGDKADARIIKALQSGSQVLFNQSFMTSIQQLFKTDNPIGNVLEVLISEPSVMIPTVISQTASLLDDKRRVTYDSTSTITTALNKVKVKIPWLRNTLEADVDVFGREVPNSQHDVWSAFFNPGNTYTDTSDAVTDHIAELYESTGDTNVMPPKAEYHITIGGKTIKLNTAARAEYQRAMGEISHQMITALLQNNTYKNMGDADKLATLSEVYAYAKKVAKSEVDGINTYEVFSKIQPYITESEYNDMNEEEQLDVIYDNIFEVDMTLREISNGEGMANYVVNKKMPSIILGMLQNGNVEKARELINGIPHSVKTYGFDEVQSAYQVKYVVLKEVKSEVTGYYKWAYGWAHQQGNTDEMKRIEKLISELGLYVVEDKYTGKMVFDETLFEKWLKDYQEANAAK